MVIGWKHQLQFMLKYELAHLIGDIVDIWLGPWFVTALKYFVAHDTSLVPCRVWYGLKRDQAVRLSHITCIEGGEKENNFGHQGRPAIYFLALGRRRVVAVGRMFHNIVLESTYRYNLSLQDF